MWTAHGQIDAQGNWQVEHIHPLRNIFNSPVYFEFAPEDLLMAELDYPDHILEAFTIAILQALPEPVAPIAKICSVLMSRNLFPGYG